MVIYLMGFARVFSTSQPTAQHQRDQLARPRANTLILMVCQLLMLLKTFQHHHLQMNIGGAAIAVQSATLAKNGSCLYQQKLLVGIEKVKY